MGFDLGTVFAEIGINTAQLDAGLRKAQTDFSTLDRDAQAKAAAINAHLKTIGAGLTTVGKNLSMYVTVPLMAAGVAAVKMAMDAVESENLFEVSMGKMAGESRTWSNELSKSLGLNQYDIRKTVGTYNVMLDSMGLGTEKSYEMAKGLTQLSYDMASFYNLKPEEAFAKLQSGISGEIEPLKQLGIIVNETTSQTWAYTHGIAIQGETLTEQEKVLARYGAIMEQTKKAQGDLARTIDSPTNQLRILTSQIKETAISFGMELLPAVSDIMQFLNRLVTSFKDLNPETKKMILSFGLVAAAVGPVLIGAGSLITKFVQLKTAILAANTASLATAGWLAVVAAVVYSGAKIWNEYNWYVQDTEQKVIDLNAALKVLSLTQREHLGVTQHDEDQLKLLTELAKKYPQVADEVIKLAKAMDAADKAAPDDSIAIWTEYRQKIDEAAEAYKGFDSPMQGYYEQMHKNTYATTEEKIATQDKENAIVSLMARYPELTRVQAEEKIATDANTAANNTQKQSVDELIASLYQLYNLNQSVTEAAWSYEDSLKNLDEVMKNANSTEREKQTAIFASQDALENLQIAMLKEYQDTETSIESKKELQNQFIQTGLEAVKTGTMSAEAFGKMASDFGLSSGEIIAMADAMDIKMDYATRQRILYLDTDGAMRSAAEYQQALDNMHDKDITITTYYRSIGLGMEAASNAMARKAMGGMVSMAAGGVVTASAGMVIPQTGRPVPVMAHEYEDIVNTSQQRNLAEWIMGKANSRPDNKATSGEVTIHVVTNLNDKVLYESWEKIDLREKGRRV